MKQPALSMFVYTFRVGLLPSEPETGRLPL